VADTQETQEEKQARWTAQRLAREQQQQAGQLAYKRKMTRMWCILGALVVIAGGIVTVVLF
jgi:hypothetical protein